MKVYITYFYNIRFFPKNMIPVSTAMYDPKWYHDFKGPKHVFKDKRGIINGLRFEAINCDGVIHDDTCCPCGSKDPTICPFLKGYKEKLDKINFSKVILALENTCKANMPDKDADICLIVCEKPNNPCSERGVLKAWFKDHDMELIEFSK